MATTGSRPEGGTHRRRPATQERGESEEGPPAGSGAQPLPAEGQQCLQLKVHRGLRLLGLAANELIGQQPRQPLQTPGTGFLLQLHQQQIWKRCDLKASGSRSGSSSGSHGG